jgi:hypothetical protein
VERTVSGDAPNLQRQHQRLLIREAVGQERELDEVLSAIECQRDESFMIIARATAALAGWNAVSAITASQFNSGSVTPAASCAALW